MNSLNSQFAFYIDNYVGACMIYEFCVINCNFKVGTLTKEFLDYFEKDWFALNNLQF